MEAALASATRGLDRAEDRWERAVAPSAGEGEPPGALARIDARLRDWEERVRAAAELTGTAENELTERTAAVERWRALFARWEELLQRDRKGDSPP
jgi:hypothetical protein